eukprot:CAMPEP_0178988232 /NCGR_PEP_ID=MMETSP0795-20121207/3702_1 /TAXON_ID=88552 /ORGANISM="Amoebophrya sp., Strain Ameob2" /LENGTH=570 /DNA_ID=CAMNT_0020679495 /DNA_START=24 /DNA_END=1739 /DNA_ORIENTATION=+
MMQIDEDMGGPRKQSSTMLDLDTDLASEFGNRMSGLGISRQRGGGGLFGEQQNGTSMVGGLFGTGASSSSTGPLPIGPGTTRGQSSIRRSVDLPGSSSDEDDVVMGQREQVVNGEHSNIGSINAGPFTTAFSNGMNYPRSSPGSVFQRAARELFFAPDDDGEFSSARGGAGGGGMMNFPPGGAGGNIGKFGRATAFGGSGGADSSQQLQVQPLGEDYHDRANSTGPAPYLGHHQLAGPTTLHHQQHNSINNYYAAAPPDQYPDGNINYPPIPVEVRSRFFSAMANLWYVASFAQVAFNVCLLMLAFWITWSFYAMLRDDIDAKVVKYSQEILEQMERCTHDYKINKCGIDVRPALEKICGKWQACMEQDPLQVAYKTKFSAATLGEALNGFFAELEWKTIVGFPLLLLAFVALCNLVLGRIAGNSGTPHSGSGIAYPDCGAGGNHPGFGGGNGGVRGGAHMLGPQQGYDYPCPGILGGVGQQSFGQLAARGSSGFGGGGTAAAPSLPWARKSAYGASIVAPLEDASGGTESLPQITDLDQEVEERDAASSNMKNRKAAAPIGRTSKPQFY